MKEVIQDIHNWLETAKPEFGSKVKLNLSVNLIEEELQELKDALILNDKEGLLDSFVDLWWVINNVSYYYGITPEEIETHFKKVSISNFSKFCKSEDEAQFTVLYYDKGIHPNKPNVRIKTKYAKTNNEEYPYVVLRESDDKILKSALFKDVADLK